MRLETNLVTTQKTCNHHKMIPADILVGSWSWFVKTIVHSLWVSIGSEIREFPMRFLKLKLFLASIGKLFFNFRLHSTCDLNCVPTGCIALILNRPAQSFSLGLLLCKQCSVDPLLHTPSLFLRFRWGLNKLLAVSYCCLHCTILLLTLNTPPITS